jgi:hypothetical protein
MWRAAALGAELGDGRAAQGTGRRSSVGRQSLATSGQRTGGGGDLGPLPRLARAPTRWGFGIGSGDTLRLFPMDNFILLFSRMSCHQKIF